MVARFTAVIVAIVSSMLLAGSVMAQPRPDRRPNIVVIVGDDMGYADLGCHGGKDIPTPRIDSLARSGVRCTNGYVSCPVCSPTRAGLVTGRYQQRFGHEFNPGPARSARADFGLPLDQKTIADHLRAAGYKTGIVGKWHLGYAESFRPLRRGFEEFFGFLGGAHSYVDAGSDGANPILRGAQPVDEKEYLTDAFTREAVAFIDRHAGEPFFLFLTYNAVHSPLQAPAKYLDRFKTISNPRRRTYAAMLSAMDDGVGAVLDKLRAAGIEENTLIFFISDNGGPTPQTTASNAPLRGTKGTVWEGGVRVPFLVRWKGRLPAGKTCAHPVISLDILPTALAAAGGRRPEALDGVDLLPYLTGRKDAAPHEALYWRFGQQSAIRKGDWKLVKLAGEPPRLFHLADDIGEAKDLAADRPEKLKELETDLKRWDAQLAEPRWQQRRNPRRRPAGRVGGR
jgi:arylsulfatase A-like enzyme